MCASCGNRPGGAKLVIFLAGAGLALAAVAGWEIYRRDNAVQAAEARAASLARQLAEVREERQRLLARTGITLIEVDDDMVRLLVARADGSLQVIPTPYSPDGEIFVDYVVHQGRVLIRRVFDESTSPREAVVVDPALVEINWEALDPRSHGRTVYRQLAPGRWMISISGAGALGLERLDDTAPTPFIQPSQIPPGEDGSG